MSGGHALRVKGFVFAQLVACVKYSRVKLYSDATAAQSVCTFILKSEEFAVFQIQMYKYDLCFIMLSYHIVRKH